jgi:hypothetical protein
MTEQDAKTKWCPQTMRSSNASGKAVIAPFSACLGSECMAWRVLNKNDGFCGLAGYPGAAP